SPDRKNPRMDKVDQTVPGGNLQPGLVPAADDGLKPYPGTRTGPERKEAIPSAKSPAPSGSKLKSPDKSDSRGLRKSDAIRNNDFFRSNSRSDRRSESASPRSTRSRSESTSPRPAPGRTQEARPSSPRRSTPSARPSTPSRPSPSARPSSPSRSTPSARPSSPSRSSSP